MPRDDGKPAGWRFHCEQFWQRGDYLMCHNCHKQTAKGTAAGAQHSPFCPRYEAGPVVRGPDLPTPYWPMEQEHPIDQVLRTRSIEKQGKPEISDVYRRWCKLDLCCNCGERPCDPHHEDTTIPQLKRGVGQKARDSLCISLCRRCHDALEVVGGGYRLPVAGKEDERHTREETLAILHDAQEERLRRALDALPQAWRIEVLSKGIASAPEAVLRRALLGSETEDRLAEALDQREEPL